MLAGPAWVGWSTVSVAMLRDMRSGPVDLHCATVPHDRMYDALPKPSVAEMKLRIQPYRRWTGQRFTSIR